MRSMRCPSLSFHSTAVRRGETSDLVWTPTGRFATVPLHAIFAFRSHLPNPPIEFPPACGAPRSSAPSRPTAGMPNEPPMHRSRRGRFRRRSEDDRPAAVSPA
ncbi:MAG: hypothetical protein D6725_08990 [Planctomycetota bacterium]|nr:MAG: hypothetical protein D6725_08990 [Planctomycetota bacterium]